MTRSYIFGDSLAELRAAAYTWLFQHQPSCFSNTDPNATHSHPGRSSSTCLSAIYQVKPLALNLPSPAEMQIAAPPRSQQRADSGRKGTAEEPTEGAKKKRNHPRNRRGQKLMSLNTPPPECLETEEDEQPREAQSTQVIVDTSAEAIGEGQSLQAQEENTTLEGLITPASVQPIWCRITPSDTPLLSFQQVTFAVMHFIEYDLLPEKGPDYRDEEVRALHEELLIHRIKTVKVIDDENIANNMLQRGGWHLFKIIGKLAPARGSGLVQFIMGHLEECAV